MLEPTASGPQSARVNGIHLAYQRFGAGAGAPLVLLHGGYGTYDMFGMNRDALAQERPVIGVDLQSHGRTPAPDRPMRFETMADDIAALIVHLGLEHAAVMGFSLGGGVALRTAIQHPEVVEKLVLVSTPFRKYGWHREMAAAMDQAGPQLAEPLKHTPLYDVYSRVAPSVDDWPKLVGQLTELLRLDYDWSADIPRLQMPVMVVAGDADGLPPSHAVAFFELLGGGLRDANWDMSGLTRHRLAILPGATHYDINVTPSLAAAVIPFLDA
jgi:pimeloyl-ACP methyl ester carboxylesterase